MAINRGHLSLVANGPKTGTGGGGSNVTPLHIARARRGTSPATPRTVRHDTVTDSYFTADAMFGSQPWKARLWTHVDSGSTLGLAWKKGQTAKAYALYGAPNMHGALLVGAASQLQWSMRNPSALSAEFPAVRTFGLEPFTAHIHETNHGTAATTPDFAGIMQGVPKFIRGVPEINTIRLADHLLDARYALMAGGQVSITGNHSNLPQSGWVPLSDPAARMRVASSILFAKDAVGAARMEGNERAALMETVAGLTRPSTRMLEVTLRYAGMGNILSSHPGLKIFAADAYVRAGVHEALRQRRSAVKDLRSAQDYFANADRLYVQALRRSDLAALNAIRAINNPLRQAVLSGLERRPI